jgi:SAM-dependent methyltransferase
MVLCADCLDPLDGLDSERCATCGWAPATRGGLPEFLSSRDREADMFARYVANYDQIAQDDLAHSIQADYVLATSAQRLFACLGDVRGRRVCDVGVGQGALVELLRTVGAAHVTAADIALDYLRPFAGSADVRAVIANAENLPFRDEFDVIVASDVFEHVLNPGNFLVSVKDALVPGGKLVVRVPHRENLTQYAHRNGCPYDLVHLRSFTRDSLTDVLQRAGFAVQDVQYDAFFPSRVRSQITRSRLTTRLFDVFVARILGGDRGAVEMNPRLARLLMTPAAVTAIAQKI